MSHAYEVKDVPQQGEEDIVSRKSGERKQEKYHFLNNSTLSANVRLKFSKRKSNPQDAVFGYHI